ncbi:hypothetical protein KAX06_06430 [candidate division WOR-3 bacterium]|nr:hypothetical protein [candidate division WOR-3 bacterium]
MVAGIVLSKDMAYRQEVFNVLLAQLLQERGVISTPEDIIKVGIEKARRMPDVIVDFRGLRTVIEGEVSDQPNAETKAFDSAKKRVVEGIAHIGVAVVYPAELREVEFDRLKLTLEKSKLRIAIFTESEEGGFVEADVDYLKDALRLAFENLVKEDIVSKAVAVLNLGVENFAKNIVAKKGIVGRIAKVLGIRELPAEKDKNKEEEDGD